jgi:rod shape determining protein RodA
MIDIVGTLKRGGRGLVANIDFPLLLITLAIMAVGLATVNSATYDGNHRLLAQVGNMGVALVVMWLIARLPPPRLMSFAIPLYVVGLVLLIAVFLFGIKVNGAKRWLNIGITRIQPSEIMKIAMPLMLALRPDRQAARPRHRPAGRRRRLLRDLLRRPAVEDHRRAARCRRRRRALPVDHAA